MDLICDVIILFPLLYLKTISDQWITRQLRDKDEDDLDLLRLFTKDYYLPCIEMEGGCTRLFYHQCMQKTR